MSGSAGDADAALDRILAEQVYAGSAYKPFSEMTVADLDRQTLASRADRLWVVPPGGSFL